MRKYRFEDILRLRKKVLCSEWEEDGGRGKSWRDCPICEPRNTRNSTELELNKHKIRV